jgi:hypothetical protein
MTATTSRFGLAILSPAILGIAMAASLPAQTLNSPADVKVPPPLPSAESMTSTAAAIPVPSSVPAAQLFSDFRPSDIKFDLNEMLEVLRDRRHEGWVLAAYPDPKTGRPLIGAGFSLDLPAREHPQRDPLNPHSFLEPASADLWRAAGLEPERLDHILSRYQQRLATWNKRRYRNNIRELEPEISDAEATMLLRVAALQAVYNARAYCRNFDQLTGPQQMALSQLVYQMGVNLEEFSQFLNLINNDGNASPTLDTADPGYWRTVQQSLIQSQWARLYRTRAVAVIAMLDPRYSDSPSVAERRVGAILRPAVVHRHRGRASRQLAANSRPGVRKGARTRRRRKA